VFMVCQVWSCASAWDAECDELCLLVLALHCTAGLGGLDYLLDFNVVQLIEYEKSNLMGCWKYLGEVVWGGTSWCGQLGGLSHVACGVCWMAPCWVHAWYGLAISF